MAAFQINDEEWGAFDGEPGDLFKAYCAIRRVMDYRTGVAGRARRISEQMLSEALYVAPLRGRHESGSPTLQRVRSVIARLQSLGLLVSIGPMVFELPLATRTGPSKSSATDEQPDQQPYEQPISNQAKASNGGACSDTDNGSATASEPGGPLNSNLPQGSGKPKTLNPPVVPPKAKSPKFDPLTARPDNVSDKAWADWCQYRTQSKKPLTAKACELIAKKLEGHRNADAVINESIANSWTGLFPEKVTAEIRHLPSSRHSGFEQRDYTAGLGPQRKDGSYEI